MASQMTAQFTGNGLERFPEHLSKVRDTQELTHSFTLIAYEGGRFIEPVIARFYKSRRSSAHTYTCLLWVHSQKANVHTQGAGKAGGYSYDKPSSALQAAISSSGISLSDSISDVGHDACKETIQAIGAFLGYTETHVVYSHA